VGGEDSGEFEHARDAGAVVIGTGAWLECGFRLS
jgi:hypothetical protein